MVGLPQRNLLVRPILDVVPPESQITAVLGYGPVKTPRPNLFLKLEKLFALGYQIVNRRTKQDHRRGLSEIPRIFVFLALEVSLVRGSQRQRHVQMNREL